MELVLSLPCAAHGILVRRLRKPETEGEFVADDRTGVVLRVAALLGWLEAACRSTFGCMMME